MGVKEKTWLGLLLFFTLLLRRSQCLASTSQETDRPNLESAMVGFDPFVANAYEQDDAGFKDIIFEPTGNVFDSKLNTCSLPKQQSKQYTCSFQFASTVLTNFSHYQSERRRHFIITQDETDEKNHTSNEGNAKDVSSGGLEEDTEEKIIRDFFLATNGEIVQSKISCVAQELTVPPFSKPVFTANFTAALKTLQLAANNSDPEYRKNIYRKFGDKYGTHYMKKSRMGAEVIFQSLFTEKEMDDKSKQGRQNCLMRLALTLVINGVTSVKALIDDFSERSEACDDFTEPGEYLQNNGINSSRVITKGPPPLGPLLQEWNTAVQQSPAPLHYKIEKISSLFLRNGIDSPLSTSEGSNLCEHKNDIQIYNLLESACSVYCQTRGGNDCTPEMVSFGANSGCPQGSSCKQVSGHSDASDAYECTFDYIGGVIVIGGYGDSGELSDVETINTRELPSLPIAVSQHTVSKVGSQLYSCGGHTDNAGINDCYTLDLSSRPPVWESSPNLPQPMYGHAAVTIGSHIWFTYFNKLYDFSTEEQLFRAYSLPMVVTYWHCAVSNDTHSYIIGTGADQREIWVNKHSSSPDEWLLVARLNLGRQAQGCLWFKDNVFIAGGYRNGSALSDVDLINTDGSALSDVDLINTDGSALSDVDLINTDGSALSDVDLINTDGSALSDVELINTATNTVTGTGPLVQARRFLGIFVLNGEPAVVGGFDDVNYLDTIETLNLTTKIWRPNGRKLVTARGYVGLVQLR